MKISRTFFIFSTLAIAILSLGMTANGQVLVENFSYPDGDSLNVIHGWVVQPTASYVNTVRVASPGLTYAGYPSSGIGNSARVDTTGQDIYRSFPEQTSGSVYAAFLANITKATAAGDYFFHFTEATTTNFRGRVYARLSGADIQFGLLKGSAGTPAYTTTAYPASTTHLIVLKYVFNTSTTTDDSVYLWVNPVIGAPESVPDVRYGSTDVDFDTLNAVNLRQGGAATAPRSFVDGIRVGTSWGLVVNGVQPPLSGSYTVGAAGNYTTLSVAVSALTTLGVSGPVTFLFTDASYSDTAQIITPYAGQGTANTVTFKPAPSATPRIVIGGGSATNAGIAVRMDSVRGIVWDGSNSGGSDRSMTIESDTNTATARTPFFIRKGSRNVTLKNMIIKGNRHSAGGIPSVVVIDNTGFASSGGQHDMTITNCQLMRGNNGIFQNAASGAVRDSNHTFTNNLVGGAASASLFDHLAAAGITMTGNHNVLVADNDVNGIKVAGTPVGIRVNGANTATTVTRNRIHNLVTTSGAFRPLCILVGNIIAVGPAVRTRAVISNNMIYDIHNFGTGVSGRAVDGLIYNPTGGVNSPNGNGSNIDWYYNSWNIDMAAGEGGGLTGFLFDGNFAGSNPTAGHSDSIKFYNNVGSIKRADSIAARMFLLLQEVTPGNFVLQSNNNDYYYYTGPFAQIPSPYPGGATAVFPATVTEFRDSTRLDSASVFGNPQFVSATDAHIRTDVPTPVESAGRTIAGITTDFDGQTRNATTPDIGADEGTFLPFGGVHDIGVASLAPATAFDAPSASIATTTKAAVANSAARINQPMEVIADNRDQQAGDVTETVSVRLPDNAAVVAGNETLTKDHGFADVPVANSSTTLDVQVGGNLTYVAMADTARFRAIVQNYGTFPETTYQVRFTVDGSTISTLNNTRILAIGGRDTFNLVWNTGTPGAHVARAFTLLGTDANRSNDTSSANFTITGATSLPGDTLYTFIVPNQIILGVNKMGPSNKLVFTSGGQSSAVTTDNRWIVTTMNGTILDTTKLQINNTAGQGFGFRDLAWDGRWLLTSDNAQLRRIDTTTFTEIATRITGPGALQRGVAWEMTNRIWKSDFATSPVVKFDTTGAQVRSLGTPPVAPYGIAFDKWTSPNRGYLWYSEPSSSTLPCRLSKVDTATGAIITSYNYGSFTTGGTSGGLDIINNHPAYPGRVVAIMVIQSFPASRVMIINLGPDSSVAPTGFTENFEAYTAGQRLACQNPTDWTTWSLTPCNTTEDPLISTAFAFSGTKSVVIVQNNDLVKRHGNDTTGIHEITLRFYIPSGKAGYFNTLAGFTPNPFNWAMECYLDSTGNGRLFAGVATAFPFTYTRNAWQTASVVVNLNVDSARFYINGTFIRQWRWTAGASGTGSPRRLAANNFFGATAWDQMFMDDYMIRPGTWGPPLAVEETEETPITFELMQNYPNPFNPSTTIRYALPEAAQVRLSIYNVLGQRVVELTNEVQSAGFYNAIWNSRNQSGSQVATGIYFYRIEATPANGGAPFVSLKKMVLLK